MSILVFVFSLSLPQYPCLCIVFVVSYIFVSVWISLPSSSPGYSGNVLMWLENSIQDFGPPELSLQSRISGSWLDIDIRILKNEKYLSSGVLVYMYIERERRGPACTGVQRYSTAIWEVPSHEYIYLEYSSDSETWFFHTNREVFLCKLAFSSYIFLSYRIIALFKIWIWTSVDSECARTITFDFNRQM